MLRRPSAAPYRHRASESRYRFGAELHLEAFDDVGCGQTFMQRRWDLKSLQGEHLLHTFAYATRRRLIIVLEKARQLLQPVLSFLRGLHFPGGAQQVQRLPVLLLRQLIEHVPHLMVATSLHRLLGSEDLLDGRSQGLGAINDEQVLTVGRQALIAEPREQALDRSRILRRAGLDSENVF